jgi:hypothetical protein
MCHDFIPNIGNKTSGSCIMATHRHTLPFLQGNFSLKNMAVISTHPTFLFPLLKIKLEGRHFDPSDVIEAELQAVLNTLAEHGFQDD